MIRCTYVLIGTCFAIGALCFSGPATAQVDALGSPYEGVYESPYESVYEDEWYDPTDGLDRDPYGYRDLYRQDGSILSDDFYDEYRDDWFEEGWREDDWFVGDYDGYYDDDFYDNFYTDDWHDRRGAFNTWYDASSF